MATILEESGFNPDAKLKIVGTNPANSRTKSGLWASDHGGVVTKLKLK